MLEIKRLMIYQADAPLIGPLAVSISPGEVLTLMGRSGVGKSTVLNWLIGALPDVFQAEGEAWLNGKRIDSLPTAQRRVGILFQDDLLFPHMTVGDNLAFALPKRRLADKRERYEHIRQILVESDLAGFYERDPASLSGGQRSRVSVLRALLAEPQAILLDEPFSRLDKDLRDRFRAFVYEQIATLNIPALLVTHDEADIPAGGRVITTEGADHAGSQYS